MSTKDRSDDDLKKARLGIVDDIVNLDDQISRAKLNPHKKERRELELQRDLKNDVLKAIDAEFRRRGVDPVNG